MPTSCSPQDLIEAAKCFSCFTAEQRDAIKVYLLQKIAGDTHTPNQLAELAACYTCFGPSQTKAVQVYLTCIGARGPVT